MVLLLRVSADHFQAHILIQGFAGLRRYVFAKLRCMMEVPEIFSMASVVCMPSLSSDKHFWVLACKRVCPFLIYFFIMSYYPPPPPPHNCADSCIPTFAKYLRCVILLSSEHRGV